MGSAVTVTRYSVSVEVAVSTPQTVIRGNNGVTTRPVFVCGRAGNSYVHHGCITGHHDYINIPTSPQVAFIHLPMGLTKRVWTQWYAGDELGR